jgi:hypothetical protein
LKLAKRKEYGASCSWRTRRGVGLRGGNGIDYHGRF